MRLAKEVGSCEVGVGVGSVREGELRGKGKEEGELSTACIEESWLKFNSPGRRDEQEGFPPVMGPKETRFPKVSTTKENKEEETRRKKRAHLDFRFPIVLWILGFPNLHSHKLVRLYLESLGEFISEREDSMLLDDAEREKGRREEGQLDLLPFSSFLFLVKLDTPVQLLLHILPLIP